MDETSLYAATSIVAIVSLLAALFALFTDVLQAHRWIRIGLTVPLFIATAYAAYIFYISREASTLIISPDIPIAIDSRQDWQPTGVRLQRGNQVSLRVDGGLWAVNRVPLGDIYPTAQAEVSAATENSNIKPDVFVNISRETDGSGSSITCEKVDGTDCPVPSAGIGALVARIGNNGQPFAVLAGSDFAAQGDGELYLRINDGERSGTQGLGNNFGILAVKIKVTQ